MESMRITFGKRVTGNARFFRYLDRCGNSSPLQSVPVTFLSARQSGASLGKLRNALTQVRALQ